MGLKEIEEIKAPQTVDANLTGKCNLACNFCWGPEHAMGDVLSTDQWKAVLTQFAEKGTQSAVFTGGEPLLRRDAVELIKFSKEELGLYITLSTNGMLHGPLKRAIPYIDEIGIPLDGSTKELNARMRLVLDPFLQTTIGSMGHFEKALGAMEIVIENRSAVHLTVRTVVSRINYDDIEEIGELLISYQYEPNRWKLYQFTPTGFYGRESVDEHTISYNLYSEKLNTVKSLFPGLDVVGLSTEERKGRYFFVMPDGDASTVNSYNNREDGHEYIHLGNVIDDFEQVILNADQRVTAESQAGHGYIATY